MHALSRKDALIYAPADCLGFAKRLAESLDIALGCLEEQIFPDGEFTIRPCDNVRGKTVIVIQSLFRDPKSSVADKLCEFMFFGRTLKAAAAKSLVLIAPYLCFSRLDRQMAFQGPVFTRSLAEILEAAGVDLVVTMDVHNLSAYQNSFRCPTLHLSAVDLFVDSILQAIDIKELTVVSPDVGGIKRCELFCKALQHRTGVDVGLSIVIKHRIDHVVADELFLGKVEGRDIVILDDMISTGSTIAHATKICKKHSAKRIIVLATHGLFAPEAEKLLQDLPIEKIMITNTVSPYHLESKSLKDRIKTIDILPAFVQAISDIAQ